jgi:hypothetical protein
MINNLGECECGLGHIVWGSINKMKVVALGLALLVDLTRGTT